MSIPGILENGRIDWDAYRAAYATMTDGEQLAFYEAVGLVIKEQRYANVPAVRRFLQESAAPGAVAEIGGWDGWLGAEMIGAGLASSWLNIDCSPAVHETPQRDGLEYTRPALFRWWERETWKLLVDGKLAVAMHVVEHLSDDDARAMFSTLRPERWLIEMPIAEVGQTWEGYAGSHVLHAGWRDVTAWLAAEGYSLAWVEGDTRAFNRTGKA